MGGGTRVRVYRGTASSAAVLLAAWTTCLAAAAVADAEARLERVRCVAGLVADALGEFAVEPIPAVLARLDPAAVVGLLRRVQRADLTAAEVAQVRRVLAPVVPAEGGAA